MKASNPKGRFDARYEINSIRTGIAEDLQRPAGQSVLWHRFDTVTSTVDDLYDVASEGIGRRWIFPPMVIPAVSATIRQGMTVQNSMGFYQADVASVTFNVKDVDTYLPGLRNKPDPYYQDRIVYRGEVFTIARLYLRGHYEQYYTVLTMDLLQVNPDELINDPQFMNYPDP